VSLPPYGRDYLASPRSGLRVAVGPTAWKFAQGHINITMVLPEDKEPSDYDWPAHAGGALIHECGQFDDVRLQLLAQALLEAGSPFVVARREALLNSHDACVYFYPVVQDVAA